MNRKAFLTLRVTPLAAHLLLVGFDNNVQTYAFNAPPISSYAGSGVDSENPSSHSNVINIVSSNDPVSSLSGSLAGSTIVLDVDTVFIGYMLGPVAGSAILGENDHSIISILDELRRLSGLDPNEINGYIFNSEDGKWYLREAVPDDRIYVLSEADFAIQLELNLKRSLITAANASGFFGGPEDVAISGIQSSYHTAEITTSPLILDLDGDGVETINKAAIHFDHDGNGFAETAGWVGKDDGLLVWDRNGNGLIDDGSELFGNNTKLANGQNAANGFAALAELDSNQDGKIDANDSAFTQLRIWKDADSDAVLDTGELQG